jgi:phage-related protein
MKPLEFRGNSLQTLRSFPEEVRQMIGQELLNVQWGGKPSDWKPISSIGPGVEEVRVRDEAGAFRAVYVARFTEAVYVLHCFQKKTQKTSPLDLELARKRYAGLKKELEK